PDEARSRAHAGGRVEREAGIRLPGEDLRVRLHEGDHGRPAHPLRMRLRAARGAVAGMVVAALGAGLPALRVEAAAAESAQRDVYVVPFSHLDFFWGGTREECLARGNRVIAKAVSLARQHSQFRFLIEDEDFVANYLESHPASAEAADLKRLV